MDPEAFHVLTVGGALQLAGIAATVLEVGAAYRRLLGKRPVVQLICDWPQRLREWWPPWRPLQPVPPVVGTMNAVLPAVTSGLAGTVLALPASDVESRLRRVEDAVGAHDDRLRTIEQRLLARAAELAELSEDVAHVRTGLDDAEMRLRRLINAVEAGNVPVRVFAAVALLLGVTYATWYVWIADHAYWLAMFGAGFAVGYHVGWLLAYRRRDGHS